MQLKARMTANPWVASLMSTSHAGNIHVTFMGIELEMFFFFHSSATLVDPALLHTVV